MRLGRLFLVRLYGVEFGEQGLTEFQFNAVIAGPGLLFEQVLRLRSAAKAGFFLAIVPPENIPVLEARGIACLDQAAPAEAAVAMVRKALL